MLDSAGTEFKEAKIKLDQINSTDQNTLNIAKQLTKSIDSAVEFLQEKQDWLKLYLGKNKAGRKAMFYKSTWNIKSGD